MKEWEMKSEYALIFFEEGEISQDVTFKDELECDRVMKEILDGKGIEVTYANIETIKRIFPHTIIKIKYICAYTDLARLETEHVGHNKKQPELYEIEHPIETIIGKITTFFERVFRKPSKTAQK
jgi:hypothetical protein